MSDTLDSKIRRIVFTIVEAGPPPPPFTDVEAHLTDARRSAPTPRRTTIRPVIAGLAALAVIVGGLVLWSLTRAHPDNRSVRTGPATTLGSVPHLGSGWSKEATFDGQVFAVATSGDRQVAVGYGIWSSSDGHTWTPATMPGYGTGLDGSVVNDVVAHDGYFVAVGTGSDQQAAIWNSNDGTNWTRSRSAALQPPAPTVPQGVIMNRSSVTSIAYTTHGFVAVGRVLQGGYGPLVWNSSDGTHWRQVAGPSELQRSGPADGGLRAITARGSTVLVAGQRTIWRTNDLKHWHAAVIDGANLTTLAVEHRAVLAAGTSGTGPDGSPTIWRSTDLTHWEKTYEGGSAPVTNITKLVPSSTSVLALGYSGDQEVSTPGLLLESHDGRDWTPAEPSLPAPAQPTAGTLDNGAFLIVVNETRTPDGTLYIPAVGIYRSR